ncbi:serine/threonine protein kinase [Archangium lipolyticum]|uniref:serine/threonine protein kinase n=1 Tax=Archangium lipolyticum TaxID=2970465 RepID=UPI00214A337B|nr:serine/threonine-protein kinase [Archangium lipolyticum]
MFRHPEPGDVVGDYRLLKKLGEGSFGLVFKAERAGRFFAVKFLHDVALSARARREVAILAEMEHPCVVRFHGFDRWPVPIIGTPYIVMDFVDGLTLEDHASEHNPSARKAARFIFQIGLTLGEVHQRGVFHRDLKPPNIVIAGKAEVPVLIDFGVGWHVGAPVATDEGSLPGTLEFQAPEAFQRIGRYECRTGDELWALGVCFYWLLTDILPFGDRLDEGLIDRILHMRPVPSHVLNPRVPAVLSGVCKKMLEKRPEDRYGSVVEFCDALNKALADAELDASWDVPLFDPDASGARLVPSWVDESDSLRWLRRWIGESPRRGRKPAQEVAAAVNPAEQDVKPEVQQVAAAREPAAVAAPVAPAVLEPVGPPVAAPPFARPSRIQRGAPARPRVPAWPMGSIVGSLLWRPPVVLVAGIAAVSLVVCAVGLARKTAPSTEGNAPSTMTNNAEPLPMPSPREDAMRETGRVREVARPGNPPEATKGAAPIEATTPALKATAMFRKPDTTKKETSKLQPQGAEMGSPLKNAAAAAAAAACALLDGGCTGSTAQVLPTPAPIACPAGWQETHDRFRFGRGNVVLQGYEGEPGETAPVREGPVTVSVAYLGKLPRGALLSGTLQPGENRVFGTFTRAQIPGGETQPVCLVIGLDAPSTVPGGPDCPPGLGACPAHESRPGNVKMFTRFEVYGKGTF